MLTEPNQMILHVLVYTGQFDDLGDKGHAANAVMRALDWKHWALSTAAMFSYYNSCMLTPTALEQYVFIIKIILQKWLCQNSKRVNASACQLHGCNKVDGQTKVMFSSSQQNLKMSQLTQLTKGVKQEINQNEYNNRTNTCLKLITKLKYFHTVLVI